jgi:hypothetical protein
MNVLRRWAACSFAVGVCTLVLCSCSSKSGPPAWSCSAKSKCPNDPPPTQDEITMCTMALGDCCSDKYLLQQRCYYDNEQCTDAGEVDTAATMAVCSKQDSDFSTCLASPTNCGDGGSDAGGGGG